MPREMLQIPRGCHCAPRRRDGLKNGGGKSAERESHKVPDYSVVPSLSFTVPKIALVGLSEEQARMQGYNYFVNQMELSGWYTYKHTNEKHAMAKVVIDNDTKRIIGAHFICNEADELVNHFAAAIRLKLTLAELTSKMYAYPTTASDILYMLQRKIKVLWMPNMPI